MNNNPEQDKHNEERIKRAKLFVDMINAGLWRNRENFDNLEQYVTNIQLVTRISYTSQEAVLFIRRESYNDFRMELKPENHYTNWFDMVHNTSLLVEGHVGYLLGAYVFSDYYSPNIINRQAIDLEPYNLFIFDQTKMKEFDSGQR